MSALIWMTRSAAAVSVVEERIADARGEDDHPALLQMPHGAPPNVILSHTSLMRIADITRACMPKLSSASCSAREFITVASIPMWSAATRSMPARASPAPRKMLPPPITTATCTSICTMSCSSPAMRLMTAGSMP